MYAEYTYYISEYLLGKAPAVPDESFLFWEKQARAEVDAYTFGRLRREESKITNEVKDCVCAIAELLYKADSVSEQAIEAGAAGPLVSFSNDGESGTFDTGQSKYTESGKKAEIKRLIHQHLGNTGLLYAGIDCCRRCCRES